MGAKYHIVFGGTLLKWWIKRTGYPYVHYHLVWKILLELLGKNVPHSILDLGCGDGVFLNSLCEKMGASGLGIDEMEDRLKQARRVSDFYGLMTKFVKGNILDKKMIPEKNSYDLILSFDVMEHMEQPDKLAEICQLALTDTGTVILRVPLFPDKKIFMKEDNFTYGEDEHVFAGFKTETIQGWFSDKGFQLIKTEYCYRFTGQLVFEISEYLRSRSKAIYRALVPLFVFVAGADELLDPIVKRKPNGVFLVFERMKK